MVSGSFIRHIQSLQRVGRIWSPSLASVFVFSCRRELKMKLKKNNNFLLFSIGVYCGDISHMHTRKHDVFGFDKVPGCLKTSCDHMNLHVQIKSLELRHLKGFHKTSLFFLAAFTCSGSLESRSEY